MCQIPLSGTRVNVGYGPLNECILEEVRRWTLQIPAMICEEKAVYRVLQLCMMRLSKLVRRNIEGLTENDTFRLR